MLQELWIENFGIVDRMCFRPGPGLNIITGETGAGKSLVLQALDLLLGSRAGAGVVRRGAAAAIIEGRFIAGERVFQIRREISVDGRSRASCNGEAVTLGRLRQATLPLLELHGQHDQHKLMDPEYHIDWLDAFIGVEDLRRSVSEAYHRTREIRQRLHHLSLETSEKAQRRDYLHFVLDEIEAVGPVAEEYEALEQERALIKNGGQLFSDLALCYQMLRDEDSSVLDRLGRMESLLERHIALKSDLEQPLGHLRGALYALEPLAESLRKMRDALHFSPERLEDVEERLQGYRRLFKKYGASTAAILQLREQYLKELAMLSMSKEELSALRAEYEALYQDLMEKSQELSRSRSGHAALLEEKIAQELAVLGMQGARVRIQLTREMEVENGQERVLIHEKGLDRVEFMLQANAGEGLLPLRKVASGGEMSRLMLALKSIASSRQSRTLVFDEIDTGVGGEVSYTIGERLRKLSEDTQVIVVTHLHQVAAFGQEHFKIEKSVQGGRTISRIVQVDQDLRLQELARMMGSRSSRGLEHAREILQNLAS
ncbi:MAG: DNA repair protein RecN [Spirochaetales bacterium]|nr:DNA repair protein RecN [Spirochaetales bacterium]